MNHPSPLAGAVPARVLRCRCLRFSKHPSCTSKETNQNKHKRFLREESLFIGYNFEHPNCKQSQRLGMRKKALSDDRQRKEVKFPRYDHRDRTRRFLDGQRRRDR
ncbi:hypothetical protein Pst134EB_023810 [Puccinia striiformis f. sp. tritici]|nr:hypothetical protein Pst134EB_023810 [Puccinia striiformis f. sp. tritici]